MNKYSNKQKVFELANHVWDEAKLFGVSDLAVDYSKTSPYMTLNNGKEIINMASCSYLGLDTHTDILNGAVEAIRKVGSLHLTTPRYKMYINMVEEVELELTKHFNNTALSYISCSAATSAFLPLYASGILSNNKKPLMIFDKYAHFSINHVKPICADETQIVTCEHNDLNYIEDLCKSNSHVMYIAEGVYSIKGLCPIDELLQLQDKYGLFLYFDDSHGLSIIGDVGQGFILNKIGVLNENTVVVSSLAKAFGACGGVLMMGNSKFKENLIRYGNSWSQYLNSAGLGAVSASLKIHQSNELQIRRTIWESNLKYIDAQLPMLINRGIPSPTRVLCTNTVEEALIFSRKLLEHGYYVSPVFFPTVPKNSPGIRFMPRADMNLDIIQNFCETVRSLY